MLASGGTRRANLAVHHAVQKEHGNQGQKADPTPDTHSDKNQVAPRTNAQRAWVKQPAGNFSRLQGELRVKRQKFTDFSAKLETYIYWMRAKSSFQTSTNLN